MSAGERLVFFAASLILYLCGDSRSPRALTGITADSEKRF